MPQLAIILIINLSGVSVHPDFDADGDVDQSDWGMMQVAMGEPHMPFSQFDMDMDGDVDTLDAEEFCRWQRKAK